MQTWLRERPRGGERHYLENGAVWCPRLQRDVDTEQCFQCPEFVRLDAGEHGFVECRGELAPPIWREAR